jgi:hypothetical protein
MDEPKSLSQISQKADAVSFRFRDIYSKMDFLSLSVGRWGTPLAPAPFYVYGCDNQERIYKEATEEKYILLSEKSEIDYIKMCSKETVIRSLERSYRKHSQNLLDAETGG